MRCEFKRMGTRTQRRPPQQVSFGLRREAKRHAALEGVVAIEKRCRRCALPPQSKTGGCYGLATGLSAASWPMSQVVKITHGSGTHSTSGDAFLAVPEPTTITAGALLLLPFGASTIRFLRKSRTA